MSPLSPAMTPRAVYSRLTLVALDVPAEPFYSPDGDPGEGLSDDDGGDDEDEEDEEAKAEVKEGRWRRQLDDLGGISRDAMLARQRGLTPGEQSTLRSSHREVEEAGSSSNPWEAKSHAMAEELRKELDEQLDLNHDGSIGRQSLEHFDEAVQRVESNPVGVFAQVSALHPNGGSFQQMSEGHSPASAKGRPLQLPSRIPKLERTDRRGQRGSEGGA